MLIKIIIAIALGLLIGAEREKTGKVIGIRTTSLISLTTCLFCLMSPNVFNGDNSASKHGYGYGYGSEKKSYPCTDGL